MSNQQNESKNKKLFKMNFKEGFLNDNTFNYLMNKKVLAALHKNTISNKQLSVIIPTYNRCKQLVECIDSILRQTYDNFEIIIVDDCSTDGTKKIIEKKFKDKRIKYFCNEKNSGAGYSRNFGYNVSNGDYIIFCDDDDYYIDFEYFENIVQIFNDENITIVCSNSYTKYEQQKTYSFNNLNVNDVMNSFEYLEKFQFLYNKPNSTFTSAFRKKVLNQAQFKDMKMMNDSSIYLRALTVNGKVYFNKKIVGVYRVHSNNISFNIKADFILENLEEKKYVYDIIRQKGIFNNYDKWFRQQILFTSKYFLLGSTSDNIGRKKVYNWIKQNSEKYKLVLIKLDLFYLKEIIKKKIKRLIGRDKR